MLYSDIVTFPEEEYMKLVKSIPMKKGIYNKLGKFKFVGDELQIEVVDTAPLTNMDIMNVYAEHGNLFPICVSLTNSDGEPLSRKQFDGFILTGLKMYHEYRERISHVKGG